MNIYFIKKFLLLFFTIFALSLVSGLSFVTKTYALSNGLAQTPPLGWNDWYSDFCSVSDPLIRSTADAMVSSGMQAAGYQYVNLDDCWQTSRDANGTIVADPVAFPNGMKAVADYVHSKGLKFGIYTDAGTKTCAGRPGSQGYEAQDAATYASWGVDFVKVDWCNTGSLNAKNQYGIWRDAIAASGRPMLFNICNWGTQTPWVWGPTTGNMWRTTSDTHDNWQNLLATIDNNSQHTSFAGPGGWNDPDIMHIGLGGMTNTEYQSNFSLFAIMASPLIAGNDIRTMSQPIHDILTNKEVIAVDQDSLGQQGFKVNDNNAGLQVWMKRLHTPGQRSVVLFNRTATAAAMTVKWTDIGLLSSSASVRDLWTYTNKGNYSTSYTATVPSHGVVMIKVSGTGNTSWVQTPLKSGFLSDQIWTYADNGWGPVETDMSLGNIEIRDGHTLTLNGATFAKGLGTHANSDIRYNTNSRCTKFSASVGIDDEVGNNGNVSFQVYGDATKLYDSGSVTGSSAAQSVNVNLTNYKQLRLVVDKGVTDAYDHADWANARVTCF
ncbi:ricin-type beta-trefoil lectin domain protein [soil metagenome]